MDGESNLDRRIRFAKLFHLAQTAFENESAAENLRNAVTGPDASETLLKQVLSDDFGISEIEYEATREELDHLWPDDLAAATYWVYHPAAPWDTGNLND